MVVKWTKDKYHIHIFCTSIYYKRWRQIFIKNVKDKDFKLKVFQKEKDYTMYKYFLPNTKELII